MRLGLWQRLGIVLTVAWTAVFGGLTYKSERDLSVAMSWMAEDYCRERADSALSEPEICATPRASYIARTVQRDAITTIKSTLYPIPFAWALGALVLWAIRWIARGRIS